MTRPGIEPATSRSWDSNHWATTPVVNRKSQHESGVHLVVVGRGARQHFFVALVAVGWLGFLAGAGRDGAAHAAVIRLVDRGGPEKRRVREENKRKGQ